MTISAAPLVPVLTLVLWTLLVLGWLMAVRIPALQRLGITPYKVTRADLERLPASERNVSANYQHLVEQPTLFYAVALSAAVLGLDDGLTLGLAWAYVGLRVVHSLIQNTVNRVMVRFLVFAAGTAVLLALAVRALLTAL